MVTFADAIEDRFRTLYFQQHGMSEEAENTFFRSRRLGRESNQVVTGIKVPIPTEGSKTHTVSTTPEVTLLFRRGHANEIFRGRATRKKSKFRRIDRTNCPSPHPFLEERHRPCPIPLQNSQINLLQKRFVRFSSRDLPLLGANTFEKLFDASSHLMNSPASRKSSNGFMPMVT